MNSDTLIYLGKATVIFSLLYLIYKLLFSRTTFFNTNRIYLLSIIPVSILFPLIDISSSTTQNFQVLLPEITINNQLANTSSSLQSMNILLVISGIFLVLFVFRTIKMVIYIQHLRQQDSEGINPFSFFNFIYIPNNITPEDKEVILAHEQVHANQLHSVDILIFEIYKAIFWFNPLAWIALKDVKTNHEYIADNIASKLNIQSYSKVLVAQLLGVNCSDLANNFNYEPLIKKRIKMMKTKKTRKVMAVLYALILPIGITSVGISSIKVNAQNTIEKKTTHNEVDVMPEFKGGNSKMFEYIGSKLKYPKEAQHIEGKVVIEFVVDEQGKVKDAKVVKGLHELLDKEALRVISSMPDWNPGKKEGKAVSVKMTLPIVYKLQ